MHSDLDRETAGRPGSTGGDLAMTSTANARRDRDRALYRDLRQRLEAADCFRPAPLYYGVLIAAVIAAIAASYVGLLLDPSPAVRFSLALLIAIATVQAGFLAHDVGDGAVTRHRGVALALRHTLMSFVSALSSSYFHFMHKVHHLTLQRGGGGLGGQTYVVNPYEIAWLKRLVAWNGYVFLAVTVLLRGLTFRLESLRYVWSNGRGTLPDRVLMALHAVFWLVLPLPVIGLADTLINYVLIMLLVGLYVGVVLIANHPGMSEAHTLGRLPLFDRVTRSTRNLGRSRLSDFVFGGVNNHIEHHLFQQIPAAHLRQARRITEAFCAEHGIGYRETTFTRAMIEAARHFARLTPERLANEALA
jgi:fatty acid desaturase